MKNTRLVCRYKADDAVDFDELLLVTVPQVPTIVQGKMKDIDEESRSKIGTDCYLVWRQKFASRWYGLDDQSEHYRLRDAIKKSVYENYLIHRNRDN